MEPVSKNFKDTDSSPMARIESQTSVDAEVVRVPKLIKPIVETEPELVEFYQTEFRCW